MVQGAQLVARNAVPAPNKCPGVGSLIHFRSVQVVARALQNAEMSVDQVDWLVLHQANQRILDSAAERLGVARERVVSNLARYGNTSAGSIPLALDEAVRSGSIAPGSTVGPMQSGGVNGCGKSGVLGWSCAVGPGAGCNAGSFP